MVDPLAVRRNSFRLAFAGLCAVVIFIRLLPVHTAGGQIPAPEILTLVAFAWVLRRPDFVPVWLVAGICILADLLYLRPLGLWTALTILGLEFLRDRGRLSREMPFAVEWALVAGTLAAMITGQALMLALFLVPQPGFSIYALQLAVSAASYPLVVVGTTYGFGVRPPSPSRSNIERFSP